MEWKESRNGRNYYGKSTEYILWILFYRIDYLYITAYPFYVMQSFYFLIYLTLWNLKSLTCNYLFLFFFVLFSIVYFTLLYFSLVLFYFANAYYYFSVLHLLQFSLQSNFTNFVFNASWWNKFNWIFRFLDMIIWICFPMIIYWFKFIFLCPLTLHYIIYIKLYHIISYPIYYIISYYIILYDIILFYIIL